MNATIDNMISRNVRRASVLALVLMMACSPAMAAGKGGGAGASSEPFIMTWGCNSASSVQGLTFLTQDIPENRRFVVNYISGLLYNTGQNSMINALLRVENTWSGGQALNAMSIPTVAGGGLDTRVIAQTVNLVFDSTPTYLYVSGFAGNLGNGVICNVTFHGYLEDI